MRDSGAHRDGRMHFWWCEHCRMTVFPLVIVCFDGLSRHLEARCQDESSPFYQRRWSYVVAPQSVASKLPLVVGFLLWLQQLAHSHHVQFILHARKPFIRGISHTTISVFFIDLLFLQWIALIWWSNEAYRRQWIFWKKRPIFCTSASWRNSQDQKLRFLPNFRFLLAFVLSKPTVFVRLVCVWNWWNECHSPFPCILLLRAVTWFFFLGTSAGVQCSYKPSLSTLLYQVAVWVFLDGSNPLESNGKT